MKPNHYRAVFIFDIAEAYRLSFMYAEAIIQERDLQRRVKPEDIAAAWFEDFLEKQICVVIRPTSVTWAKAFTNSSLNQEHQIDYKTVLERLCYHRFAAALHPTLHPCFFQSAHLRVTPHDLTLEYDVPYTDPP